MNGQVNEADYVGGGTPVNAIMGGGNAMPQQQPQGGAIPQGGQQMIQQQMMQQQAIPQQHQQNYYPHLMAQNAQNTQREMYTQQPPTVQKDMFQDYTNCKPMEIVIIFVLFICLTNCIVLQLQKQLLPTNLYSRYNNPPWILVFINAVIFIIIYILLYKYAFN